MGIHDIYKPERPSVTYYIFDTEQQISCGAAERK